MDKSFGLLRTNVGLTTNIKLSITASYSLYLDTIDSQPELSKVTFKKQRVLDTEDYYFKIKDFYKGLSPEIAYFIKDDNDSENMTTNFANQFDEFYNCGAKNIVENKSYEEEFEYFAPLHVTKNLLPTHFIIFRVDGPGLIKLNKDNFRSEILNRMKVVQAFDLTKKTSLGKFLDKSINSNSNFPYNSLYIDFRRNELSTWYGIDYQTGGFAYKKENLESFFKSENTFSDTDKYFFDSWKNKKLIYPFIFNLSFLFDDKPATPTSLRKWSMNRYMGFYFDKLELYQEISPNSITPLEDDVFIDKNNILKSKSGKPPFSDPDNLTNYPYIEVEGVRYKVLECPCGTSITVNGTVQSSSNVSEDGSIKTNEKCWKIISDKNLEGKSLRPTVKKPGVINIESVDGVNTMKYTDDTLFTIPEFDDYDMWLIDIDGKYHKLVKDSLTGNILIYTDYAFNQTSGKFEYYINDPDKEYRKSITLKEDSPLKFYIYRCKFTDVKDFDIDVVDTKFAKYEYEKESEISQTKESKFFLTNLNSSSFPKSIHDFNLGNEVVYIPCSSHYTANNELFRLIPQTTGISANVRYVLNTLWKKNAKILKWGFQNSLSTGDTAYLLNNSLIADDFNRTTNTLLLNPNRIEKNLDYFYTINSDSSDYVYHSLHVEDQNGGLINTDFKFEMGKYLGVSYSLDYFSYFFGKRNEYLGGTVLKNDNRWSIVNSSGFSSFESNNTLFKGLKFTFFKVRSIKLSNKIDSISREITNELFNYKFSILFSENDYDFESSLSDVNKANVFPIQNILNHDIYDNWRSGVYYATNSVVLWNDMLFQTATASFVQPSVKSPLNTNKIFQPYDQKNIYWSPIFDGTSPIDKNNMYGFGASYNPAVYNAGQYWYIGTKSGRSQPLPPDSSLGSLKFNFWNPYKKYDKIDITTPDLSPPLTDLKWALWLNSLINTNYAKINSNNCVIYTGRVYISIIGNNNSTPTDDRIKWVEINFDLVFGNSARNSNIFWRKVPNWTPGRTVFLNEYLTKPNQSGFPTLYVCKIPNNTIDPSQNATYYNRIHSFTHDPNYTYGASFSSNDLIQYNNKVYKRLNSEPFTPSGNTRANTKFNDGINIIINKKWKNILVNIYSNDGLLEGYLKNKNRDGLYNELFKKFVSRNFSDYVNSFDKKYGFSNILRYIIINENDSVNIYDFSNLDTIKKLPYVINVVDPEEFGIYRGSLSVDRVLISDNVLKASKRLDNGKIFSLEQVNWYSDVPYANIVNKVSVNQLPQINYNSQNLGLFYTMYRHNGFYSPVFNDIQLFKSSGLTYSYNNYKFDTDLTDFGMSGEIIISKANRDSNILKLSKSTTQQSIYPMLDEFGYHVTKSFIFKSSWDFEYLKECKIPNNQNIISVSRNITLNNNSSQ
jgi:hypothetical protein